MKAGLSYEVAFQALFFFFFLQELHGVLDLMDFFLFFLLFSFPLFLQKK